MPILGPLLPYATRAVADLRPRDLNYEAEVGSILGGIFGGLAVLVAVIFGVWQIVRWNREDKRQNETDRRRQQEEQRRNDIWYRKLGRTLRPW